MVSWFSLLESAKSVHEVVAVARDYVATWTPEDLARLPQPCRPGKLRDETDIEMLHGCLVEEYRSSRATGDALMALQELTSFMVRASIRVAQLSGGGTSGGSGSAASGPMKSAAPPDN